MRLPTMMGLVVEQMSENCTAPLLERSDVGAFFKSMHGILNHLRHLDCVPRTSWPLTRTIAARAIAQQSQGYGEPVNAPAIWRLLQRSLQNPDVIVRSKHLMFARP